MAKKGGHDEAPFEFFGPYWGPAFLLPSLPLVIYVLYALCNEGECLSFSPSLTIPEISVEIFKSAFSFTGLGVVLAYLSLIAGLHFILPAKKVSGTQLKDGSKLTYRMNALFVFGITYTSALVLAGLRVYAPELAVINLAWAAEHFLELATATVLICVAMSVALYVASFRSGAMLCHGARGYMLYDFWMGRELNPRLPGVMWDLKEWCELYPGLIGWAVLNLCMAVRQYDLHGYVSTSMVLVNVFQFIYVLDALYHEPAILTTMDITTDGFGFMLVFGDLAWVPFTYTTQARFLAANAVPLGAWGVLAITALNVVGYVTFRGSNSQKDAFRRDPKGPPVRHLKTLETKTGRSLIISGWWGIARHINYTGDWMMGLAWCLTTGFYTPVTYFYAIYFLALLLHRDARDYENCKAKYGSDWDKFCSIVRYSMFPYVY